ncbi:MAG: restriction endonuclease [Bacteroidales bacterium]|nr:restriction endonuclease [Bacteroidales bacterium]
MNKIIITKKSGEKVPFDESKLRNSLERSGAGKDDIEKVLAVLDGQLVDGMSTHKIYQKAYDLLKIKSRKVAGRYRLKKAMMELGPTGYPFERFVGKLIEFQGFDTEVGVIVKGKCVKHEVDVVAESEAKRIIVECKFHRQGNRKSDVKVAMYIRSRFTDIENAWKEEGKLDHQELEGWLVTNTRFTEDALTYGKCAGLKLISWDYPEIGSLRQRIDHAGLHPITSLHTMSKREKQYILDEGLVLCKELSEEVLFKYGLRASKVHKIMEEANSLISNN